MKKFAAVILSVILMLSSVSAVFAETAATELTAYEKEIGFLSEIGLLPFEFSPDAPMTRGAFAKMVTDLIYYEVDVSATHETSFNDLQYGTDFYNAVAILEGLNVVKGNGANAFNPLNQITLQDALVITLRVMGYEPFVAANGAYPAGYLYTGKLTGLTREIGAVSALDMKTAAKLIYNMLFVSHVGIEAIEADGIKLGIDYTKNYLSSHLNIIKHDARLINDGMISYDNVTLLDNQVILEDLTTGEEIVAECTNEQIGDFFGCYLDAYVKYDKVTGYAELVYCGVKSNVITKTIDADDIVNASLLQIEYEEEYESGKTKKVAISTENPAFFRNGIRLTQAAAADLKPQFGNLKLIDNNGDSASDVVIINDIKSNIVASSMPADYSSVMCKENPVNSLDLDETVARYRVYKGGKAVDISEVKEGNILSVAPSEITKSGYQLYIIYVSDAKVSGVLNSTDSAEKLLYIGDSEYKVSDLYYQEHNNMFQTLLTGENITVYLDYFGEIAYIDGIKANNINYAYLLNVTQKSAYEDVRIVLYSKYGAFSNHIVSDNITIDGKKLDGKSLNGSSVSKLNEICELLNLRPDGEVFRPVSANAINPRVAIIKVNTKGQIYYIDTDNRTHDDETLENTDPYVLTAGTRYFRTERLYFSTTISYGTPDGTFLVDNDTLVLQVPDVDRYDIPADYSDKHMDLFEMPLSELAGYKLISYNEMNSYQKYDMQPYNIDPKTGVAKLLVLRGYNDYGLTQTDYAMASSYVVFKKLTSYYDPGKKDKILYKLYYTAQDGTEGSVIVDEEILPEFYHNIIFGGTYYDAEGNKNVPVEKLQPGDVIFFGEEAKTLKSIGRLVNLSDINNAYVTHMTSAMSSTPYKNVYGPANNNTIDVPFDVRRATTFTSYGQTYFFSLASAQSLNGTIVKCALPYTNSEKNPTWVGTFNDYYNNGTDCLIKYVPFDAALGSILVVEEKKHSAGGNCEIQIRSGSLDDLKLAESFAADGFRKSSKIFFYSQAGVARNAIIYNLDENHDR